MLWCASLGSVMSGAISIVAEIGGFSRFSKAKSFVSFIGLCHGKISQGKREAEKCVRRHRFLRGQVHAQAQKENALSFPKRAPLQSSNDGGGKGACMFCLGNDEFG